MSQEDERSGRTIVVDVTGPNAFDRAKSQLNRETDGVDADRVRSVRARIEVDPVDEADEPVSEPKTQSRSRLTESDRSFGDVTPGSAHHEALQILHDEDTSADDPILSTEVADLVDYQAASTVSVSLGKLYRKKCADRRDAPQGTGYHYWISDHGETVLEDIGAFDAE